MTISDSEPYEVEVLVTRPKKPGIEFRVSKVTTPLGDFLDFREFVTSTEHWGRGVTMPISILEDLKNVDL